MATCKDCLHLEACSRWTDFPKQCGEPTCRHFIIETQPTADVVPKSEDGAECPTCHGTGRIGTTDWLTKNISKKQLAKEKAEAIAEHELYIKQDYAREIFAELEFDIAQLDYDSAETRAIAIEGIIAELKKKYTEKEGRNNAD